MTRTLPLALTLALLCGAPPPAIGASADCQFTPAPAGSARLGKWIGKDNWLDPAYGAVARQQAALFMPTRMLPPPAPRGADKAAPELPPGSPLLPDPLDEQPRTLDFLLDARLSAAGVVVMHKGQVVAERYRRGLRSEQPRLLLETTRPLLNLLGAMAIAQGRLSNDKSLARSLPPLAQAPALRKLSVQRLLNGSEKFEWTAEEIDSWRKAAGWSESTTRSGMHAWLSQSGRWPAERGFQPAGEASASPEDELLAWLLTEGQASLASQFCEQLLSRPRQAHPILWVDDPLGTELANGLAMSLRDFANLGQFLLEARGGRSRIPNWFIETLTASAGLRHAEIPGLPMGSELRYGFYRLGGKGVRVALLGGHGDSLFIDFDRRLVIAIYAEHPTFRSPALLATLDGIWSAIARLDLKPVRKAADRP